ncbi:MAG TPA: hypothetical protein VHZ81_10775 [Galbitalea sp.]|jgi:hypothetical protein|nr:hypothetical protein [Galbitalea sp.]
MAKRGSIAAVAAVILVVSLAGCAPATITAEPTRSAVLTPTPTQTPAPIPTPLTPDQLEMSPDGLGPIIVGEPISAETAFLTSISFNDKYCDQVGRSDWQGTDLTTSAFSLEVAGTTASSPVSAIGAASPQIRTAAGIRIGSTRSDVTTAYPSPTSVMHGRGSDLYITRGSHGQLSIEVADSDYQGDNRGGLPNTVISMTVWSLSVTPSGFVNSDVSIGGCS